MRFHDYSGDYVIFGSGGLAHELWGWIKHSTNNGNPKRLLAFVDDRPEMHGEYDGIPIVGRDKFSNSSTTFILALGGAIHRKRFSADLENSGWIALSYVHESALVGVNVVIGKGVVVCPRVSLSSD